MTLKLKDPSLLETRGYINGEWVSGETTFPVTNPATGEVIAEVADLGVSHIRTAIDAAEAARHEWAAGTGKERSAVLRKLYELMVANVDDLGAIITAEMGKPLAEAKGEILYGASYVEWFAEEAKRIYGETIPGHQRDKRIVVIKQPVGVVGAITPWNFPNAMLARKIAPALAVGCSVVSRPANLTPLSALALAVLAERAGLPAGLLNVVPGAAPEEVGKELCANPKVKKITFTGSTRVGSILMAQCAPGIKKLSLELGGNAPFIVFEDADLEAAADGAIIAKFRNSGQTCVCANRLYVHDAVYDAFVAKLQDRLARMKLGNGMEPDVVLGPLISDSALRKVEHHLQDALSKGALVVTGGRRSPHLGGTFFEPTILTEVTPEMRVSHEETFGPLAPVIRFKDEAEVLAMANDTEFGLAGYFFSQDINRIWRVAEKLETGMVGINTGLISTEVAPFGGVKSSGVGREGSHHGCKDYLEMKYLCFGNVG